MQTACLGGKRKLYFSPRSLRHKALFSRHLRAPASAPSNERFYWLSLNDDKTALLIGQINDFCKSPYKVATMTTTATKK